MKRQHSGGKSVASATYYVLNKMVMNNIHNNKVIIFLHYQDKVHP